MHNFAVVDPDLELRGGRGFACPDSFSSFQIFFLPNKLFFLPNKGGASCPGPPGPYPRPALV